MLEALEAPPGALVVMDRGVATEACVQWLREHDYRYLVVSRTAPSVRRRGRRTLQTQSNQTVHLHKVVSTCAVLLLRGSGPKEQASSSVSPFETALIHEGLAAPAPTNGSTRAHRAIEDEAASPPTTRSGSPPTRPAKRRCRHLDPPSPGRLDGHPSGGLLPAQQPDWDEDALCAHTTLTDVEAVFRSLKAELGLRPIYHHKPRRADGHLFITHPYQLVQVNAPDCAGTATPPVGPRCAASWTARASPPPSGAPTDARCTCERPRPEPEQRDIYDALGVDPHPGGSAKRS